MKGIHLYHLPIGMAMDAYIIGPLWQKINFYSLGKLQIIEWHSYIVKLPIDYLVSIGVAYLSFNYIEKPLLRLRNNFSPTTKKPLHKQRLLLYMCNLN